MSMPEFLNRLRLVSSMLPPGILSSEGLSDTPADERLKQKALASADVWLDAEFIAGVKGSDFYYLEEHEQKALETALERITILAEEASRNHGLTKELRSQGLDLLIKFVNLLTPIPHPDKLLIDDLWKLENIYPEYVLGFGCEFGTDSTGDPAVWVRAVVPDEIDVQTPAFDRFMDDVTRAARAWLDATRSPHWPYIRLLTPSDIKDQIAEVVE